MRTWISALALTVSLSLGFAAPVSAATEGWSVVHSKKFGFSMLKPDAMKLKGGTLGKWGWMHGTMGPVEIWGAGRLGEPQSAQTIQAFGVAATKIPAKYWHVVDEKTDEDGWDWYRLAVATNGKDVLWAKYGNGPKGSYIVLLKTTVKFSATHGKELKAFADAMVLD